MEADTCCWGSVGWLGTPFEGQICSLCRLRISHRRRRTQAAVVDVVQFWGLMRSIRHLVGAMRWEALDGLVYPRRLVVVEPG